MSSSIGTSGWAYHALQSGFNSRGLKAETQLAHFVTHFAAVEINGCDYRIASTVDGAAVNDARHLHALLAARYERPRTSISEPRRNIS